MINKRLIDHDERARLQFIQRNKLLNFFMNMTTYQLQDHLNDIAETHADGIYFCGHDDQLVCKLCEFVSNNEDAITLLFMWCECGHPFNHHHHGIGVSRCLVCHCEGFNEIKLDIKQFRKEYDFRPKSLNCRECNALNQESVAKKRGDRYLCSECHATDKYEDIPLFCPKCDEMKDKPSRVWCNECQCFHCPGCSGCEADLR